ncbi:uncharacterized protein LOC144616694 [Panthera onca]
MLSGPHCHSRKPDNTITCKNSLTSGRSEQENLVLNSISANATPTPRAKRHPQKAKVIWSEEDWAAQSFRGGARNGDQTLSGSFLGAGQTCHSASWEAPERLLQVSAWKSHPLPVPHTRSSDGGHILRTRSF